MKHLLILFILSPFLLISQINWKEVKPKDFLIAIQEFEESIPFGENYSLETTYDIFKNSSDDLPVQSTKGVLTCRNGNELNVFQMGFIMVQDDRLNLTIDTVNQQIVIQKPDSSLFYRKTVNDVAVFSEMTEVIYKRVAQEKIIYSLELKNGYPYRAIELEFSGKEMISKIVIYSNQPYIAENFMDETNKAKIVINFTNFKKGKSVNLNSFKTISDYIIIRDVELIAIGRYKDFELIDLRN